jgi:hypoxanthine phosphoribosyltransferase
VLVNKRHDRKEPGLRVDFVGLEVEDRYVFGCGMDYKEYLRNLPAIYAVAEAHA